MPKNELLLELTNILQENEELREVRDNLMERNAELRKELAEMSEKNIHLSQEVGVRRAQLKHWQGMFGKMYDDYCIMSESIPGWIKNILGVPEVSHDEIEHIVIESRRGINR